MMKSGFIGIIGRPNVGKIDIAQQHFRRKDRHYDGQAPDDAKQHQRHLYQV